ncbi:hypothetical protein ABVT39_024284 [Epinephelus coioides]
MDPELQNNPCCPDKVYLKVIILESYYSCSSQTTDILPGRAASVLRLPYLGFANSSIPSAPQTLSNSRSILSSIHESKELRLPSVRLRMHMLHLFPMIHHRALQCSEFAQCIYDLPLCPSLSNATSYFQLSLVLTPEK